MSSSRNPEGCGPLPARPTYDIPGDPNLECEMGAAN
jgi:hypothetical protein